MPVTFEDHTKDALDEMEAAAARALEIIAGRAAERQEIEHARAKAQSGGKSGPAAVPEFVPMEDLFS